MDTVDKALEAAGIKRAEDCLTNFEHVNDFEIHRVDIQIPDDKTKTRWTVEVNKTVGTAIAHEKPESGWLDIQSEGKVFCRAHEGDTVGITVLANDQIFISGRFKVKPILDFLGSPGFTFLIDNSMMFVHIVNVVGKGHCVGAVHVSTDAFVDV
jgi:hypothetical protein